jgi:hypothetical protein
MDWLEDELKQALGRKEPSADFQARVTDAARRRSAMGRFAQKSNVLMMPRWAAAAAAVLVIVGASAGYRYRQGQAAKEQVMLAMRITGSKLNRIQLQMKAVRP